MPVFFMFGAHAFVWGTTSIAGFRQRAVPTELQGRVGAVNLMGVYGGLVIGAGIGGLIAQRWGVSGADSGSPSWGRRCSSSSSGAARPTSRDEDDLASTTT